MTHSVYFLGNSPSLLLVALPGEDGAVRGGWCVFPLADVWWVNHSVTCVTQAERVVVEQWVVDTFLIQWGLNCWSVPRILPDTLSLHTAHWEKKKNYIQHRGLTSTLLLLLLIHILQLLLLLLPALKPHRRAILHRKTPSPSSSLPLSPPSLVPSLPFFKTTFIYCGMM